MRPPDPLAFEDFGLTREQYDKAPKPLSDRIAGLIERHDAPAIFFLLYSATVVSSLYLVSSGFTEITVGRIVLSFFLGFFALMPLGFGLMAVGAVAGLIESLLWTLLSPTYRAKRRYDKAFADYKRRKAEYDRWVRKRQEQYWRSLKGRTFEYELASLFKSMGYSVETTPTTGDAGVDLILRKGGTMTIVQCKAHARKVGIGTARELSACLRDFNADQAIIACLEGATRPVTDYIRDKPIEVIDVHGIVEMQRRYG